MKEKIFEALMALAAKLGTTAENLWDILVRQNDVIIFRYHIALWVFGICLALFVVGLILLAIAQWEADGMGVAGAILAVPSGLVGICVFFYLLSEVGAYTTALRNPEYNALYRILESIGGN